jgi:predicted acylesterase/phospholipase RssA
VLRELPGPIDLVVGTSMGSVAGGAFAAGHTVQTMELVMRSTDWQAVVADRPARDQLNFRRRGIGSSGRSGNRAQKFTACRPLSCRISRASLGVATS